MSPIAVVALVGAVLLVGCSQDRHVYRSTPLAPKSVSIVSVETGNTLWTKNVPVGQQLMLDFSRPGGGNEIYSSPNVAPNQVKWETWSLDAIVRHGNQRKSGSVLDSGSKDLPGEEITIKVDILDPEVAAAN
ncbi:MAG: hypothetical protein AAFX76_00380 [Planctomycetota bacterium]